MSSNPVILPDERALFARMAEGDETAFGVIFFHYSAQLSPFIISLTRSESAAEEIIQEVFLSLWLNRAKLAEVENFRAYVLKASNNRVYSWLKKRARDLRLQGEAVGELPDPASSPEAVVDLKESLAIIEEAVAQLPAQKKLIWRMSRGEGLSHAEIADKLGLSKNTVKNHLVVAIRMIREHLDGQQGTAVIVAVLLLILWEG